MTITHSPFWLTIDAQMRASADAFYVRLDALPKQHDSHVAMMRQVEWARLIARTVSRNSDGSQSAGRAYP